MAESVSNVLLAPHSGAVGADDARWYLRNKLSLSPSIWVGRLQGTDFRRIRDACDAACFGGRPAKLGGYYYAIVDDAPAQPESFDFDPLMTIRRIVGFSRYVHATNTGFGFVARVWRRADGRIKRVLPPPFDRKWAFGGDQSRPWLTPDEWGQVSGLVARWPKCFACGVKRFNSAAWWREHAAQEYYLDVRWQQIVTAIESLVGQWNLQGQVPSGGRAKRGKRFVDGVIMLASSSGQTITAADAYAAWERRSSLAHGAGFPPAALKGGQPADDLYDRVERILSGALRRMLEDDAFAANFADQASVDRWIK